MNPHSLAPESGDSGEFSTLLELVLVTALKTATFPTRGVEDAEDLTQEAALQSIVASWDADE